MIPALVSFIAKLTPTPSIQPLEWQGLKVDKSYFKLKGLVPTLTHGQLLTTAILLQNLVLEDFTVEELSAVANLPLMNILLVDKSSGYTPKNLVSKARLFDTESSRVYSFISLNVSKVATQRVLANFLHYRDTDLATLITSIAAGGS